MGRDKIVIFKCHDHLHRRLKKINRLLEVIREFSKFADYKISIPKSVAFLNTSNINIKKIVDSKISSKTKTSKLENFKDLLDKNSRDHYRRTFKNSTKGPKERVELIVR